MGEKAMGEKAMGEKAMGVAFANVRGGILRRWRWRVVRRRWRRAAARGRRAEGGAAAAVRSHQDDTATVGRARE